MATNAQRRLIQDLKKIQQCHDEGIDAMPDQDNLFQWQAVIYGPQQTIWEGATLRLNIQFTNDYPNKPPLVQFRNKIFHPNIYNDGKICIDILQNKWSHLIDLVSLLTSIRSLLSDPNPESPANPQASKVFVNDKALYHKKVRESVQNSWKSMLKIEDYPEEKKAQ